MNVLPSVIAALVTLATPLVSLAQAYPAKAIRVVIPLSTGSTTDLILRAMAPKMGVHLGQPVVLDNQPGAGGAVGTTAAARAAPDGYTWLVATSGSFAANPHLNKKLGYDPVKDFIPVCRIGLNPYVLVTHPSVRARSLAELLGKAGAGSPPMSFASAGTGSSQHMAQEMFKARAGGSFLHVPYKGAVQATTDTIGGHSLVLFEGPTPLLPHIRSGKLVPLAITGGKRLAALPGVPTFEELGYAGLRLEGWIGLAVPANTPPAIVDRVSQACQSAVTAPDVQALAQEQAFDADYQGPREFRSFIAAESQKWGDLVKSAGIQPE
jgi:tripartite-type tricarboxylate transporter receptor subunit TctC